MLKEEQRRLWRSLAVFPQTFDDETAAAVWEMEREAAQDSLGDLMKWSLVEFSDETKRYRLHDLARLFAEAWLSEAGAEETDTTQRRFARHYCMVLATCNSLYEEGNKSMLRGLAFFDREWRNIRVGQAWAETRMKRSQNAAQLCIYYPEAGAYVLALRLHPRERIRWLEVQLAAARQLKQRNCEGAALGNLGVAYKGLGETRKAIEFYEQDLTIAREIGDSGGEGIALWNLSLSVDELGDHARAITLAEAALKIFEAIEHPHAERVRKQLAKWRGQKM